MRPVLYFCMWISTFPNTVGQRDYPFPIVYSCLPPPAAINQLTVYVWIYFWVLYSLLLVYMSIFMPVSYCFDCYRFVTYFEIKKCEASPVLFFLLKIAWLLRVPFWFLMNLRVVFVFLQKMPLGFL